MIVVIELKYHAQFSQDRSNSLIRNVLCKNGKHHSLSVDCALKPPVMSE